MQCQQLSIRARFSWADKESASSPIRNATFPRNADFISINAKRMAAQGHPFCESLKVSLANVYIIKERVGRITGIVVVMAGQGQRVGMTRRHTG
jgi:hypothetical protein